MVSVATFCFNFCILVSLAKAAVEDGELHRKYKAKLDDDHCDGEHQVLFGGECFTAETTPMSWIEARKTCLQEGGDLAVLEKVTVMNALSDLTSEEGDSKLWVGMMSKGWDGENTIYTWVDGTEVNQGDLKHFIDEPSEGCVLFNSATNTFETEDCDSDYAFMCEESMQSDERIEKEIEKEELENKREMASSQMKEILDVNTKLMDKGELIDIAEGDIKLLPEEANALKNGENWREVRSTQIMKRNIIDENMDKWSLWPDQTVPYYVDKQAYYNKETAWFKPQEMLDMIDDALEELDRKTCVNFKKLTSLHNPPANYIVVKPLSGCYSYIGKVGGRQELSLAPGCKTRGTIQHEFMHAMGFYHEQSRRDRDSYVQILFQNIKEQYKRNFEKASESRISTRGFKYDIRSIMQYGSTGFAIKYGLKTIVPHPCATPEMIGQRGGATPQDIAEINELYSCNAKTDGNWGLWSCWSACSKTCGGGQRKRTRECDNPAPRRGGAKCSGMEEEAEDCYKEACKGGTGGQGGKATVSLGCWNDHNEPPLLASTTLEGKHQLLKGPFTKRVDPFEACFKAASDLGIKRFALRSGECFAAETESVYQSLGPSDECTGEGSIDAIDVFFVFNEGTKPWYKPQYGVWKKQGSCSQTCGGGQLTYTRQCDNPAPPPGSDKKCSGVSTKKEKCATDACPGTQNKVNGRWNQWSTWSSCSKTCGIGEKRRTRQCNNPAPSNGGKYCRGRRTKTSKCQIKKCNSGETGGSNNGSYGPWSVCSKTCGIGYKHRVFSCPANASPDCRSYSTFTQCYEQPCGSKPIPATGTWGEWSKCDKDCGSGYRFRVYKCPNSSSTTCKSKTHFVPCYTRPC